MWSGVCEYPSQKDESSEMHYMLGKIKDKNASKYVKIKCSITTYHHHNIDQMTLGKSAYPVTCHVCASVSSFR